MGTLASIKPDHYLVSAAQGGQSSVTLGVTPDPPSSSKNGKKKAIASYMVFSTASNEAYNATVSILKALGLN